MEEYVYIDEAAARTGLTKRTVRFWEEKGLLAPPARTEGGHRLYSAADISRLVRVRELRDLLGLSLDVIKELLHTEDELEQLRAQARQQVERANRLPFMRQGVALLEAQVRMIADRIARLQNLQQSYDHRLARMRRRLQELEGRSP